MAFTMVVFTTIDLSTLRNANPVCALCKNEITPDQGWRRVGANQVHDDCHFDGLSALIDQRPIHRPEVILHS
jgi:hypothetical protein